MKFLGPEFRSGNGFCAGGADMLHRSVAAHAANVVVMAEDRASKHHEKRERAVQMITKPKLGQSFSSLSDSLGPRDSISRTLYGPSN